MSKNTISQEDIKLVSKMWRMMWQINCRWGCSGQECQDIKMCEKARDIADKLLSGVATYNKIETQQEKDFTRFKRCLSHIKYANKISQIDEFEKFGPDRLRLMVFGENHYFNSKDELISNAFEGLIEK